MTPGEILAIIFAWSAPFIIGGSLICIIKENWNEYRSLCHGFIGGYIIGLMLYVSIVPSMFV